MPTKNSASTFLTLLFLNSCTTQLSAPQSDLQSIFTAPVTISRTSATESIPIELHFGKLFLNAAINGQSRQFIFDTGSPTLLTRDFAEQLSLTFVGQNTGLDANGTPVTMDIAVVDTLALGELVFNNVPVMVFDPPPGTGACIFDGGVIGSEIFPGSAWRIDLERDRLEITDTSTTQTEGRTGLKTPLYDSGYPHAPIVDYYLADSVSDKALFDTGSADNVVLFAGILANSNAESLLTHNSIKRGFGFAGGSAGGMGQAHELLKFELNSLRFDDQAFPSLSGTTRTSPPTLLGAGLLRGYVVTLDYIHHQAIFEPRPNLIANTVDPNYSIAFVDGVARVVQLFENSPAAKAGLKFGDRVLTLQGKPLDLEPGTDQCSAVRWLLDEFDSTARSPIQIERAGQEFFLEIPSTTPARSQ